MAECSCEVKDWPCGGKYIRRITYCDLHARAGEYREALRKVAAIDCSRADCKFGGVHVHNCHVAIATEALEEK